MQLLYRHKRKERCGNEAILVCLGDRLCPAGARFRRLTWRRTNRLPLIPCMQSIVRVFLPIALLAGSAIAGLGQAFPDNPAPAPTDPASSRLQRLANGTPVVVDNTSGPPVHCLFAGATDAYLFCDPPGNPAGVGYRFARADVLAVDYDRPSPAQLQARPPQRNYHPVWLASMIAGGIVVGFCATRTTGAGHSAGAGLVGAAAVGLIGAPLTFLPQNHYGAPAPPYYGIGVPLRPRARSRLHALFRRRALP